MKFNIIHFSELDSTNNYAQQQIENNLLNEGDVIFTTTQKAGKGQGSNEWESKPGCNLLMSLILVPKGIEASQQFVLTQIISLAIVELIKRHLDVVPNNYNVTIKWPNDIYVNDKKIAGMLFQNFIKGNAIEHSIVGIGINVNQTKFISSAPNPISLINYTNKKIDIPTFLNELLICISEYYEKYKEANNLSELKNKYIENLYQHNCWANYANSNSKFTAKIIDVDQYGRLIVLLKNGEEKIFMFKEIEFCCC